MLTSEGLNAESSYNAGPSTGALSRDSLAVSKNNIDSKDNSCGKLMQESSGFGKLQKDSMKLDIPHGNLKQESSYLNNSV